MDVLSSSDVCLFGPFRFDRRGGVLLRRNDDGRYLPVSIGSRAFAVLGVLIGRPGDLISRDEIMRAAWPGTVVEEGNLAVQISALRRILDAGTQGGSCIQTVSGRGYRFVLPVSCSDVPPTDDRVASVAASHPRSASLREDIAVLPEAAPPGPEPPELRPLLAPWRRQPVGAIIAAGAAAVAVLAAGGWWTLHGRTIPPVGPVVAQAPLQPVTHSPQDRRQSIIVLPFENSGRGPTQDDIAAVITRDVQDRLAQYPTTPLVPAETASAYRGKTLDVQAIGRDSDVHFALTGDARRQDGRLIVSATLYETNTVRPVWSQRFDRPDSPDTLDRIIAGMSDDIERATMDAELAHARRDHPDSLDKRDLMFAARGTSLAPASKANLLMRIALNERALALDPDYVWALRDEALNLALLVLNGFSSDREADLSRATKVADRALQLAANDVHVLRNKANVLRAQGHLDQAAALLRRVIELAPQWGWARRDLGLILLRQGHHKEALENLVSAKRFISDTGADPLAYIDSTLAMGLLVNDRLPEAIEQARVAIGELPAESGRFGEITWLTLIAAESANGQDAEGRADLQLFLASPRSLHTMAEIQKNGYYAAYPKLLDALRHAGMPAE
jgi:DNA-binding winged helix-turn-helix (wHTH) protein/TolB-like protein